MIARQSRTVVQPRLKLKKRQLRAKAPDLSKGLWINPRSNIRGVDERRVRDSGGNISPSAGARLLELADIALGLKKPVPRKKKPLMHVHQVIHKTEPYAS